MLLQKLVNIKVLLQKVKVKLLKELKVEIILKIDLILKTVFGKLLDYDPYPV